LSVVVFLGDQVGCAEGVVNPHKQKPPRNGGGFALSRAVSLAGCQEGGGGVRKGPSARGGALRLGPSVRDGRAGYGCGVGRVVGMRWDGQ